MLYGAALEIIGRTDVISLFAVQDVHPSHRNFLGRPGLEPGTNPESFRGYSVNWRSARLKLRVADSFFVLESARVCVPRPLTGVPSPRQVRFGLRTVSLCDCCRVYAPRFGAQGCRSHRCNTSERRARCKPKPYKSVGRPGLEPGTNALKGRCSTD